MDDQLCFGAHFAKAMTARLTCAFRFFLRLETGDRTAEMFEVPLAVGISMDEMHNVAFLHDVLLQVGIVEEQMRMNAGLNSKHQTFAVFRGGARGRVESACPPSRGPDPP